MRAPRPRVPMTSATATVVVAVAAALWATDAFFRPALARQLAASQIVLLEDLLICLCLLPVLALNWQTLRGLGRRRWIALGIVGVGPQAIATVLFTRSIAYAFQDPRAPDLGILHEVYLLYLLQPVVGLVLARLMLGERRHRRFWPLALFALAGVYLVVFADAPLAPLHIRHVQLEAAALVLAAVAMWASGTVLGRYALEDVRIPVMTALRFVIALPVLAALVLVERGAAALQGYSTGQLPYFLGIALIPGLFAMFLYYTGLANTPASLATIAELAYPCVLFLVFALPPPVGHGNPLHPGEFAGAILLVGSVTALNLVTRRRPVVTRRSEARVVPAQAEA